MRSANFVEETTTSIAGAGGNGAVTLAAIASVPRFSTVFGTQATTIRYVIEDTVGKRFETGIGSVSSNVLTRTRPQVTWDGTTYDDSTPSHIAFGSSPTSGSIRVRLAATAETQGTPIPGFAKNLIGHDSVWGNYPISAHYSLWNNDGSNSTFSSARHHYQYYKLESSGVLQGIQFEVMSSNGGGLRMALYSVDHNGMPGNKIVDFGTIDVATTGVKTQTDTAGWTPSSPVWLTPGWYAVGFIFGFYNGGQLRCFANQNSRVFGQTPLGRSASYAAYKHGISVTGKSFEDGMPTVADTAGAELNGGQGVWFGLGVTA